MRLVWRDVEVLPDHPPIFTSLTAAETAELQRLVGGVPELRVLEIGAAYGYSTVVLGLAGAEEVYSVDPHETHASLPELTANVKRFGLEGRVMVCIGTSQAARELRNEKGRRVIPERYFGMVFIDGDHTREGVRHDLLWARRLVKPFGSVIACHDYGESTCPGVKEAIDEMTLEWRAPSYFVDTLAVYSDPRG